jgi:hypothetical protein
VSINEIDCIVSDFLERPGVTHRPRLWGAVTTNVEQIKAVVSRAYSFGKSAGVLAERERCAKVAEDEMVEDFDHLTDTAYNQACRDIAAAIRQLSGATP